MSKSRYVGLSALFLAIAMIVSGSLVMSLREATGTEGQSLSQTIHLLQQV